MKNPMTHSKNFLIVPWFVLTVATSGLLALSSSVVAAEGGSNNGGGNDRTTALPDSIAQWCRGSLEVLREARTEAGMAHLIEDYSGAVKLLMQGLEAARANPNGYPILGDSSLTSRAIERGRVLGAALIEQGRQKYEKTCKKEGLSPKECARLIYEGPWLFLSEYYRFIDAVADQVDMPYYIPYHGCWNQRTCVGFDEAAYEARFIKYAQQEILLYLGKFVTEAAVQGGTEIFPVVSGAFALKILEHTTKWAADDLSDSLFGNRFACAITELKAINAKLAAYNSGVHSVYGNNEAYAVNIATTQVTQILATISNGCGKK